MDQSRSSSSSSSQHYAALLTTVSELRTDLEKAVNRIQDLEQQNQNLSDNYQVVKSELVTTRKTYLEAKDRYLNAVAEKFESERQHDAFMERIKAQLVEKTKEFDLIRDKLVPHDIDQLRIKVQEELEIQHKGQIHALEYNMEQERAQFFSVKREYERGKSEYEVLIQNQQQELVSIRSERDEVETDLRAQIVKIRDVEYTPSKDEKMRSQRAKLSELTHLTELLREEAKSARQERDASAIELEQLRSSSEQTMAHLKSRAATAEAERSGIEERLSRTNAESDRKDSQLRTFRQKLDEMTERLDHATKVASDLEKQMLATKDDHNKQIDILHASFEAERTELQERVETLSDRLTEKEEALRQAQRAAAETAIRGESMEGELRRAHQLQIQEARRKHTAIEIELADARTALKTTAAEAQQSVEHNKFEVENLRSELSKVKREKDLITHKIRELELALDTERRKFSSHENESGSKIRNLENNLRTCEVKISSYETKLAVSRDIQFESQNALQIVREQNNRLEAKTAEQSALIDAMRAEFRQQVDALGPSFKEETEQLKKKMKLALAKEKKRAEAYKGKAVEAHHRAKALTSGANFPNDEIALLNSR